MNSPLPDENHIGPRMNVSKGLKFFMKAAPFFLGAAFLLSGFFAIFTPIPLLFTLYQFGFFAMCFAIGSNGLILYFAGSPELAYTFMVLVFPLLVGFACFATRKNLKIEAKVYLTWFIQLLFFTAILFLYAHFKKIAPLQEIKNGINQFLEILSQSPSTKDQLLSGLEAEEWKKEVLTSLPVTFAMSVLILTFANFYLMIGLNPRGQFSKNGLTRKSLFEWRMPDFLVWPIILCWVIALLKEGTVATISFSVLKLMAAGYGIQGIAIFSLQLDRLRLFGFFRSILFVFVLLFMMPLILGLGFFDQWFDFRAKFRQSDV